MPDRVPFQVPDPDPDPDLVKFLDLVLVPDLVSKPVSILISDSVQVLDLVPDPVSIPDRVMVPGLRQDLGLDLGFVRIPLDRTINWPHLLILRKMD